MATNDKDTIYIDIDDEITGIIDKVKASEGKVVALVLPKRASVFQSIVNMKLLKRAADSSKKHLVLITSEAGLLPLAGAAGVHVAKTLTSKPEIPVGPDMAETPEEEALPEETAEIDNEEAADAVDAGKSVGELAGAKAASDGVETLMLDDEDLPPEAGADKPAGPKTFEPKGKGKKNKKLKVPDFDRFRLMLVAGGLALLLLIIGIVFAGSVLPKAKITIKTDATTVNSTVKLNLSTTAKALSEEDNTLPAKQVSQQKTYSQQVPTTGQKNNGNKASGSVTVTNCNDDPVTIPAGTGFASGGNTYISQETISVPGSNFTSSQKCKNDGRAAVNVLAQNGGSSYNKPSGASFTIASGPANTSAQGGTIDGGTDSIVQIVNQNDVNNAKAKIVPNENEIKTALQDQLKKEKYYPIVATYSAGPPAVTMSANVGDVANTVTVTEVVTYTMFGVHKDDLKKVAENEIKTQIDTAKQSILDNGVDKATYTVDNLAATGAALTMSSTATAGPDIDVPSIRQLAAGKKPGAIKDELRSNPDVTNVDVKLSPFWVSSVPKKTSRITVDIAKPKAAAETKTDANQP